MEEYQVSIYWEDRISGDSSAPLVVAKFRFYHDACEFAKNKLAYYSTFVTAVDICIMKGDDILKCLSYIG